jgi:PAS domain S-box-containing protein
MFDFFTHLFDTSDFRPRWHCGLWTPGHGWLHILSDLGVWSAYLAIPCVLGYFVLRKRDVPFRTIFWLFGAFILACGTTHLMEVLMFWWPAYRLAGVVKLFTALVSWGTVIALVPVVPRALAMRSPEELEQEIAARQQAEGALQRANAELELRVQQRTADLARANEALRAEVEERKRVEEDLRGQREQLRITLASIGDGVIVTDARGRVTSLNPVTQALTGWGEEAVGRPLEEVFAIVNEQTRQPAESPVARALREGTVVGLANHTLLIARDGTEKPIDDSAAPIRDEQGNLVGVVLVFRDVTERRRAEEARFRLAAIVESSEDAVIGKALDGTITSWNLGAERLYGYSAAEAVGRPSSMLVPPGHANEVPEILERLRHGQRIEHYEAVRRRKDGTLVDVWARLSPVKNAAGQIVGASVIARDVSARNRAEAALRDSEERLRSVVNHVVDGIISIDEQGTVETFNPAAERIFGYAAAEVIGQNVRVLMPEPYHGEHDAYLANYLRTGQAKVIGIGREVAGRRKDGATFPLELAVSEFHIGPRRFFTGIVRDITERKRLEQELGRRLEELADADRRKNEFLAMLAHELRNPLAPIRNALHIMKQPGADGAVVEQVREMMERQVQHMTRMVDDLLDVSRISRGKIELRKEVVDLAQVVTRTVEATRPLIEDRRHELTVSLPPGPVRLEADSTRLEQVLANLLSNAAKYTDQGGHIWLTARAEGDAVVLRVRDTGIGIVPEMLGRIFEPFVQSDRAQRHSPQGGLGIGLTLVRSLVEMHGGTVRAYSDGPGRGSEFVVRLPALAQARLAGGVKAGEGHRPVRATPRRRIVVVDDNVDAAESLALVLRLAGHDVRVAHDGPTALAAVDADPPDLVFLDIGMPVMNGYEVARRLRQRPGRESLLLVAMTGWGQEEDRRLSREAGFDHHLVKPADPEALQRLLADPKSVSP